MSDNVQTPPVTYPNTPKNKKRSPLFIVLLLLLLPAAVFVGIKIAPYFQSNTAAANVAQEKALTVENVEIQADSLYRALQSELDYYKNQTDSLYPEITEKEDELEKQYIRLQNLIRQAKQDGDSGADVQQKTAELRNELMKMRKFVDDQTLDIAEMRRQNNVLLAEKKELSKKYEQELSDKERLEKENRYLNEQKKEMSEQVSKASVLQITNIKAVGAKLTTKGTDKDLNVAKKVEFIKVCFDVVRNEVVRLGVNKFYMLITDPTGWPIVIESRGSGKLELMDGKTPREEFYTTVKSFNYNTDFKELCLTWSQVPSKPFEKGIYHIEIFNQGYLVGKTTLTLK